MAITRSLARNKKTKASKDIVSHLPAEIIEWEILPRLAVKSLLPFKSVCKSWKLLISDNHDFIKSHLDLNPNKDSLVLEQQDKNHPHNSFISKYSILVGCIDGLVCVYSWVANVSAQMLETAIWNPATSRCLEITPLHVVTGNNILLGFGFDSVANDFKVVCASLIEGQPSTVDVYSCKAACWKKIAPSNILYSGINIFKRPRPTIIDGSPYWLSQKYEDGINTLVVISFDIRNEVFRSLPSISYNIKFKNTHVLSNFRDSVAIMVYELGTYSDEPIDVYMFNQRCSVWNKISIETFMVPPTTIDVLHVKLCFRNGDILCGNLDGRRLYRVNPKTRTIKILEEGKSEEYISNCCNYSESLVFIEGMKPIYGKRDEGRFKFLLGERLEVAPSYQYT